MGQAGSRCCDSSANFLSAVRSTFFAGVSGTSATTKTRRDVAQKEVLDLLLAREAGDALDDECDGHRPGSFFAVHPSSSSVTC
jgi:hypothetical protein